MNQISVLFLIDYLNYYLYYYFKA